MRERGFGIVNVVLAIALLFTGVVIGYWIAGSRTPETFANKKPEQALAITPSRDASLPAPTATSSTKVFSTMAESKLPAASTPVLSMEASLRERDPLRRARAIQDYIEHLDPSAFASTLAATGKLPESADRDFATRLLVERWATTDPDGALQFAAGNRRAAYMGTAIFEQLAATDTPAALTKAQALPEGELRSAALRGVITYQAQQDPARALQLAQSLGKSGGADVLSNLVLRDWAASNPTAAGAQALLTSNDREGAVSQVVRSWAAQDPAAALSWSASLPDPAMQRRAISQGVRQWAEQDPTAAATWLNTVGPGTARDAAVASFTNTVAWTDPKDALVWAQSISDEAQRNEQLQRIGRTVLRRDPQNGPATLQAAGLPPNFVQPGGGGRRRNRPPGGPNE